MMVSELVRKKKKSHSGFTLIETLVTMLIVLIITAMMASGIHKGYKIYCQIIELSHAQMVLSTTTTLLRYELATAQKITITDKNKITYVSSAGVKSTLQSTDEGIKITQYGNTRLLISDAATGQLGLRIKFEEAVYQDDLVMIEGLQVFNKKDKAITEAMTYKIRNL